ncbi:MAG: hypothetical protein K2Y16_00005, partial [Burkholderiales bacterium]|nr:hypothetical protein [Burkholderiales bacterium]
VKADINREMALDDLRKLQANIQDTANAFEQSVNQEVRATESELNKIAGDTRDAAPGAHAAPTTDSTPVAAATPDAEPAAPPAATTEQPAPGTDSSPAAGGSRNA